MQLWFSLIQKYSQRDQLSFNYAIYKTGLKVKWIEEKVFDNAWFSWYEHSNGKIHDYMIYYGDIYADYDYTKQENGIYTIKDKSYIINEKIISEQQNETVAVSVVPEEKKLDPVTYAFENK